MALVALAACGGAGDGGGDDDDGGDDGDPPRGLTLPQARRGAMLANPAVYAEIPVRVEVDGDAGAVTVAVGGVEAAAARADDGAWIAPVPIAGLADGEHALEARAGGVTASATLVIARAGRQLTAVGVDGNAGTPRLHDVGGRLHLTWTDSRDGARTARIVELDGAGRFVGEPAPLLDRADDVIYARAAVSAGAAPVVGVLFQEPGGPYENWFAIVDLDGAERVAPIALDPEGRYGSAGGDVAWDGEAFVVVWRVNDGAGASELRWMRVTRAGEVTGPVTIAGPGGFDPFTVVGVEAAGGASVVAYTRDVYDPTLELDLPACHVVTVDARGEVGATERARPGWYWHHECRLLDGGALLVWGEQDLNDPSPTPPTALRAARVAGGALDPARGPGAVIVTAPDHRTEPAVAGGAIAWLDERTYEQPADGRIELYAARLDDTLAATDPVVFAHARFIEGTSELSLTPLGPNRLLLWIDERHGNGITDPRPELWLDTAWY